LRGTRPEARLHSVSPAAGSGGIPRHLAATLRVPTHPALVMPADRRPDANNREKRSPSATCCPRDGRVELARSGRPPALVLGCSSPFPRRLQHLPRLGTAPDRSRCERGVNPPILVNFGLSQPPRRRGWTGALQRGSSPLPPAISLLKNPDLMDRVPLLACPAVPTLLHTAGQASSGTPISTACYGGPKT